MKKTLVVAIASASVLTGCSGMKANGVMKVQCDEVVTLTVTSGFTGVNRDPIVVGQSNRWLCWELDATAGQSYKLTADSISIKDNDDEFSNCKAGTGGDLEGDTKIACHDKNNKHAGIDYKYTIQVYPRDPQLRTPKPYDPYIVNN